MNGSVPLAERPVSLSDIVSILQGKCAQWLAPQRERLRTRTGRARPKVFNDPVWGSIRLYSWEVALLDSLWLQRLRYLKQLGVVHWVFPGAGHSRFEHTLGVVHQMQAMLDGLERNSGLAGERVVDDATVKLLRLAALVHDSGHCVMSHVSEPILKELPGVAELIAWTRDSYQTRKPPSASEAIAAIFVTSPGFKEFLSLREVGADFIEDVDRAVERMAGFLLGGLNEPGKEFLSLLMSGAYDADKLDYMPRDCLMAGVPCALDVARVIEKVHCFDVEREKLPQTFQQLLAGRAETSDKARVLTLASSATRTLHEVAMTRSILFQKVYYHPTVRALEVMVRRLLDSMRQDGELPSIGEWLELADDEFLQRGTRWSRDLRTRRLLKRAFTVSPPLGQPEGEDEPSAHAHIRDVESSWRRLRKDWLEGKVRAKVIAAAKEIAQALGLQDPSADQEPEVDLPDLTRIGLDQWAFVGEGPEEFRSADATVSGARPETAKRLAQHQGYVFASEAAVLPVFLASRWVLATEYRQDLDALSYAGTRLDPEEIVTAEGRLKEAGVFQEVAFQAIPSARARSHRERALDVFLKTAWPRIENLSVRFGPFQSMGSSPISPARIATFLRQFESEDLARPALRVLEAVELKDRQFFRNALQQAIEHALAGGEVDVVCPLGATGDSSALLSYLMHDLPDRLRRPVDQLELALEQKPKRILAWDDFCSAGGHCKTVLAQWLGFGDAPLLENLVRPLSPARRDAFLSTRVDLQFAMAQQAGLDAVTRYLAVHEMTNIGLGQPCEMLADDRGAFSRPGVFRNDEEKTELMAFLRRKMRAALESRTHREVQPWSEEKLVSRLLGYGNLAHLLVFFYNVPTVTLTALWAEGAEAGRWWPLFPRRGKAAAAFIGPNSRG
jgi:HD superfamily phosphohydrolase